MIPVNNNRIEIEYRLVSELIPYAKNPRKNDKAVDAVAESIKEFGFKVPVRSLPVILASKLRRNWASRKSPASSLMICPRNR